MTVIQRQIQVSFQHQVHFTDGVFDADNGLLAKILASESPIIAPKVLVMLEEGVHHAQPSLAQDISRYFTRYRDQMRLVSAPFLLEGGERVKNAYFHVSEIQSEIDRYEIDRHSYLVAVGGGAFLDVAGLAAATAHRGVRHVRIPTTTLSQADSGVGVKNGINAFGKKNFIGTFAVPYAVINDLRLLESLPERDKRAGYSEAVKVACVRDEVFFALLEANSGLLNDFHPEAMRYLIQRSAELHVNHIAHSGDPFEMGTARPLDFGHWAAHKLEQLTEYRLRHGEAVAMGIAIDTIYSRLAGYLGGSDADRILSLLENLGFVLFSPELLHTDSHAQYIVLRGLEEFRIHLGGELTVTLLQGLGRGFEVHEMELGLVTAALHELKHRRPSSFVEYGSA